MTEPEAPELDPREELALLTAATRALLEQYEGSGADLVPGDPAVVAAFLAGAAAPGGAAAQAPQRAPGGAAAPAPQRAPGPPQAPQRAPGPQQSTGRPGAPPQSGFVPPAFVPPQPTFGGPPQPRPAPAAPAPPAAAPPAVAPPTAAPPTPAAAPFDAGIEDDRKMRLALLQEEVRPCTKCPLCETRTQTVFARGNPFAEVCFVGEGPGADEDAQGEPFVGRAGQLLDRMIVAMGYRRDDVYICNIVKCRPPENRKPEPSEMAACMPYLKEQLALVKPKVIVALGGTAMTGLIGTSEGITRLRGKWKLYKGAIPIMPTFHPAYLLRNPPSKREVWSDLQEVMKHLGKPLPARRGGGDE